MSTKANWPEGMKPERNLSAVFIDNAEHWYVKTQKDILLGVTAQHGASEYRARQICALPKMVEFHKKIKAMSEKEFDHTWFPDEILEENEAILREIGEVE